MLLSTWHASSLPRATDTRSGPRYRGQMATRLRAVVHGRVQGVGFRDATARVAERAAVAGCAANLPDGTVEVELEGDEQAVESVLEFLRHGPPAARVTRVETTAVRPRGETLFRIL